MVNKGWVRAMAISAALLVVSCAPKPSGPVRSIENGVEVVDNGAGYYSVPGQPKSLTLKEEFRIDLEDEALAKRGLTDIAALDVDARGDIFLFRRGSGQGLFAHKFDGAGRWLKSFCPSGQGPGEVEFPRYVGLSPRSEICILGETTLRFFDTEGRFLRQLRTALSYRFVSPGTQMLRDGKIIASYLRFDELMKLVGVGLGLFDEKLDRLLEIRAYDFPSDASKAGRNPLASIPIFAAAPSGFYASWGNRNTEIAFFDFDGKLQRVIRAETPIFTATKEYRHDILERLPKQVGDETRSYVASLQSLPPFQSLAVDGSGRLFVSSMATEPESGAFVNEIFSPQGIRFLKKGIGFQDYFKDSASSAFHPILLRDGRAYCVHEKASGYKEVIVYRMVWS